MSKFLFDVQKKNRLKQKGLLQRFSITCYGHQNSVEEMKAEKARKFKELKDKKGSKEYEEWFLNYKPTNIPQNDKNTTRSNKKTTKKTTRKNTKKNTKNKTTKTKKFNFKVWNNK
jgi:hypothetical protein